MRVDEMQQLESDNTGGHSQRPDGNSLRAHVQGNLWLAPVDGNIHGNIVEDGIDAQLDAEEDINLFEEDEKLKLTDVPFAFDSNFEEIRMDNVRRVSNTQCNF